MELPPPLRIATLQPAEIAAAKALIMTVADEFYQWGLPPAELARRFEDRQTLRDVDEAATIYAPPDGLFLTLWDGAALAGTGAVRRWDAAACELKRLWLRPAYRGRGLGYALTRRLLDFAQERGYTTMRLTTDAKKQTRAVAFYRRLGFVVVGGTDDPDDLIMARPLQLSTD